MYKEIATGEMKIKHHITEYTKTPPPIRNTYHYQGRYGLPDERHQESTYDGHHNGYRDNHRNSMDFRMDRRTSMEEEILRKLRQVIQMETDNWGTADRGRPRY